MATSSWAVGSPTTNRPTSRPASSAPTVPTLARSCGPGTWAGRSFTGSPLPGNPTAARRRMPGRHPARTKSLASSTSLRATPLPITGVEIGQPRPGNSAVRSWLWMRQRATYAGRSRPRAMICGTTTSHRSRRCSTSPSTARRCQRWFSRPSEANCSFSTGATARRWPRSKSVQYQREVPCRMRRSHPPSRFPRACPALAVRRSPSGTCGA